jgi:hypothetical protein
VSVIQLIASPEKYHGKLVSVKGFMSLEVERRALFLHKEDCDNAVFENALWLDLPPGTDRGRHNRKYVAVEGVFDAGRHGHLDAYPGTVKVKRVLLWGTSREK